jgi:hypothetical protein
MSIDKAKKAKNSGTFIEQIKKSFTSSETSQLLEALSSPPTLKWSSETEVERLGLIQWLAPTDSVALVKKLEDCIEKEDLRVCALGALYLFGSGNADLAIKILESGFEKAEKTDDYKFHAENMINLLIGGSLDGFTSDSGKMYVKIPADYLKSTVQSVAEDFNASGFMDSDSLATMFAQGIAKAGDKTAAAGIIKKYADTLSEFSDSESLIYCLTKQIEGLPAQDKSPIVPMIEFIDEDVFDHCMSKATSLAKKNQANELKELKDYIATA